MLPLAYANFRPMTLSSSFQGHHQPDGAFRFTAGYTHPSRGTLEVSDSSCFGKDISE
jgi:hypothetical protein